MADPLFQQMLKDWADEELRPALKDKDRILKAAAVMKVAIDKGEEAHEALGKCICVFVLDLIDESVLDDFT